MKIIEAVNALRVLFAQNNINTESLHVILNFADPHAAAEFDRVLKREIYDPALQYSCYSPTQVASDADFEMVGIQIRIESPLHSEPQKFLIK